MEEVRTGQGLKDVTVTREDQLTGDNEKEASQESRLSGSECWASVT